MAVKSINLADFSEELGDFMKKDIERFRQGVASGLARSLPDLVERSPIDTGLYAQSWMFSVDEQRAIIGNTAPHAPIIEYGARPFTPPMRPLLEWAKRVLNDPSQPPNYSKHVWALAKYTQQKIQREGMKPRYVLQEALPTILENIRKEVTRVFTQ